MYAKTYIFALCVFFSLKWELSLGQVESLSGNCPIISAKPQQECVGRNSICWSPGQYDVDCSQGSEVCCFDGCVNICGKPKVCQTVYQERYENVTKIMCNTIEQPPNCQTSTTEECHDDCMNVDKDVTSYVEDLVCKTVTEPVCSKVETEQCVPPTIANQTCPVIHLKSPEECKDEAPSNCWSPGVPDLDCDNSGLCCFNGCFNRCLKNCYTESDTICTKEETERCSEVEVEYCSNETICRMETKDVCQNVTFNKCENVTRTVVRQVSEKVCIAKTIPECRVIYEKVCNGSKVDSYQSYVCRKVPNEVCIDRVEQDCQPVVRSVEDTIEVEECMPVTRPKCRQIFHHFQKNCVTVVVGEKCHQVAKEVCPPCEKRIVENVECKQVPREKCWKEPRPVKTVVKDLVCNKVCVPKPVETCVPVDPKEICNPVVKTVSYPVPVWSCQ